MVLNATMSQEPVDATTCGESFETSFMAGQHFEAGIVSVSNTEDKLYVSVSMNSDWVISQTQLYVGNSTLVPVNKKGNPQVGLFPVKDEFSPYASVVTYEFNLDDFDDCFMVAFHANVHRLDASGNIVQSETAWAKGKQFIASGSWASYFTYCKQECTGCVYITESFQMYGGQTIPTGHLFVTNDEQNLYVTYQGENGWQLATVHLYIGTLANLPKNNANTPVPGQFPYINSSTTVRPTVSFTIPLTSLPPCYIIAAHGEAKLTNTSGLVVQSETSWSFGTQFPNTNRWGWYSNYCTQTCER